MAREAPAVEREASAERRASEESRRLYDLWAGTYPATAHNPVMRLEQEIVEPMIARLTAARALDVGTGSGRYLPILAATGAPLVVGIDFSMGMLTSPSHVGRVLLDPPPIFLCGDAMRLPFRRGAFDLVNASLMVGDIADLRVFAAEMARVLARGGHLIYSDFHPSWAQHGWRRTFKSADGAAHDIGYEPHAIDDHLAALEAAGLRVAAVREPRFKDDADPEVAAFRRRWRNPPIVAVFHAVKDKPALSDRTGVEGPVLSERDPAARVEG